MRTLAGVVLVLVCIRLGIWQLDRNEQRSERNGRIEANSVTEPVPIDDLLPGSDPLPAAHEWRQVTIEGSYDPDHEFLLNLRPLDGESGVHVVTPLVTAEGTAVLVDRGFVAVDGPATERPDVSTPPSGRVEVTGRLRVSEEGRGTGGSLADGAVRFVDVDELAADLPYPLYGGWTELVDQQPPADDQLQPIPSPEIDAGPHLSYAIQWFLFACVGLGGFVLLIRAEARGRRQLAAGDQLAAGEPGDEPGEPGESGTSVPPGVQHSGRQET